MSPERLYGWLLRLLPFDFRADYGGEMRAVFRDEHHDARRRGPRRLCAVWARNVGEILRTAPREHLAQLGQDVRHALRGMRRDRSFTAAAVLTLALGVGANTAVYSLVYGVLLAPLPWPEADRMAALWNRWDGDPRARLSDPEYLDYAERARTLQLAALAPGAVSLGGGAGEPERVASASVSTNTFTVLDLEPVLGRGFRPEEEREGEDKVAILSHALWSRRFARDPDVLGRTLLVADEPRTIVGVLPEGGLLPVDLRAAEPAQIVLPLVLDRAASRARRGGHYLGAVARLAPGVSAAAAQAEMDAIVAELARTYPDQHDQGNFGVSLVPLGDDLLGPARPVLLLLLGAVSLVLLVACANVAGLLLARGETRRRELAIRASLGASRLRILRQMVTEGCVLAVAGAAAGIPLGWMALRALARLGGPLLPRAEGVALDLPVLAFTTAVAVMAGISFGAAPAIQVARLSETEVLSESPRGGTGGRAGACRLLAASQVAIAVVLVFGAGLLVKSLARLQAVPVGLDPTGVLTLRVNAPAARYPGRPEVTAFFARTLDRVRALPGVTAAGAANGLPLAIGSGDWGLDVEGRPPEPGGGHHGAPDWFVVTPGYFEALGIPLLEGRPPAVSDDARSEPVILLNHTAARALFPRGGALDQRVRFTRVTGAEQPFRRVVGVVGDVRHRGLDRPPRAEAYVPHAQFLHFTAGTQSRTLTLVVRAAPDPAALAAAVRAELLAVDPAVPAAAVRTMDDVIAASVADRRRNVLLVGAFALLALALAAVGLHGVLAYLVARRTREIGVRLALGASPGRVRWEVIGEGLRLVGQGLAAGVLAAMALGGLLRGLLFGVGPRDAWVFAATVALLSVVGFAACWAPARQATRTDPATALRE